MMKLFRMMAAVVTMIAGMLSLAGAAEQAIFGPEKYDVKERYGKVNRYTGTFTASEALYLLKFQNGDKLPERSDWIEFTLNGEKLLKDGKYGYSYFGGFVNLKKENTFEIVLKDEKPSGFRRPALPPRFVTLTVNPAAPALKKMKGVFGLNTWDGLNKYSEAILKIKSADGLSYAMTASSLQIDVTVRSDAMRKLSDLKEHSAQDYLLGVYGDVNCVQDVRGEAALALGMLGDKAVIPVLIPGVLDPEDKVSIGSARALSFYKEEDTQGLLMKMLERLDYMRQDAAVKAIVSAGWKPVGTIMKLAESTDHQVANTATKLLGGMQDARATDLLLKLLDQPGARDQSVIINALGDTKDPRAVEPLLKIAHDPERLKGKQADLGEALANLGDQRAAEPLADMIKKADSRVSWERLRAAYKKLTGKDFK
ncbi:MAG: HEAT repeat domain-containing protein [Nitrospirota bacterium]|mgnify:CR=1 FL=1